MKADIREIHTKSRQSYGERRIKDDLADLGKTVSRQRIGRLMKEEDLACKTKRKFKATTDSSHSKPVADNLLKREFTREQPDQAYVGDITYIPTREGWLYLSVFIDWHGCWFCTEPTSFVRKPAMTFWRVPKAAAAVVKFS
ncbi:hypothetical protein ACH42_05420 [Endozoicomonas sp. (ex Bugula neritina AB1)]|nr:hypothetical protein ACH42_05420 [Endozoicomonas sp. (ex Bugula neritina AB1)]